MKICNVVKPIRKEINELKFDSIELKRSLGDLVLQNSNVDLPQRGFHQFIGNPGVVSELLKLIVGVELNFKGKYLVNGEDLLEMTFEEFLPFRLNMGYGFDFGGLLNNRTLRQNIMLPIEYHNEINIGEAQAVLAELLDELLLNEFADLRPAETPGYVRKLACFIRAIIHNPTHLILDCPTTAVDFNRTEKIINIVNHYMEYGNLQVVYFTSTYINGFKDWKPQKWLLEKGQLNIEVLEEAAG